MRKLLLANLGAAVGLGAGAVGVAYAVTHKLKDDKNQSGTVQDVNNIFKQIQNLYTGQTDIRTITDNNYNSLYTFIQQSIAGTIATITTSTDKKLELQRSELLEEINKIKAALDAHTQFDGESFAAIYTALANMNLRLDGIDNIQQAFETKFNNLVSDYKSTATELWAGINGLQTYVDSINATNLGKFNDLNSSISAIEQKLLQVDELRSMVLSTEEDIHRILKRLRILEADVQNLTDKQGYDLQALQAAIAALETADQGLSSKITVIDGAINNIWTHIDTIITQINNLKDRQDISEADLATIKAEIANVKSIQNTTSQQQLDLIAQFNTVNDKVNSLFIGNSLLQTQIDYLNNQNTQLYANFLYLQSAINNLESMYGTGGSTTVSIKPSLTDPNYTIYEKGQTNANGILRYPSIEVPNLNAVKRFAIYVKVTNTSTNASYVTQIIDSYPNYDYKLLGSSTQGFNNEQFLVSIGLDKNVNKININGLWTRKSSDSWKTSKDIDNTTVQITNIVATY